MQVVILGISILKNRKRPSSRTVRLIELEKRDRHPTLPLPPGLQSFAPLEVSTFQKLAEMEVWPTKKVTAL